jgi:predicted nucleic acid-binding protein
LHGLDAKDVARAAELETTYASLNLGFVDAAVIVTCERLGETKVATLDRRGLAVVRPRHCDALRLLPE